MTQGFLNLGSTSRAPSSIRTPSCQSSPVPPQASRGHRRATLHFPAPGWCRIPCGHLIGVPTIVLDRDAVQVWKGGILGQSNFWESWEIYFHLGISVQPQTSIQHAKIQQSPSCPEEPGAMARQYGSWMQLPFRVAGVPHHNPLLKFCTSILTPIISVQDPASERGKR